MHFFKLLYFNFFQSPKPVPMKILSVEDIERNIHNQQQQKAAAQPNHAPVLSRSQTPLSISLQQQQHQHSPRQPSPSNNNSHSAKRPIDANTTNGAALPNGVHINKPPHRLPPGFPAMSPMMGGPAASRPPLPIGNMPAMHPGGNMAMPAGNMHRPPPTMPPPHFPVSTRQLV